MSPEGRPMIQLPRKDVVLKLYWDGDSCTHVVAKLRQKPATTWGLTAGEPLHRLAKELDAGAQSGVRQADPAKEHTKLAALPGRLPRELGGDSQSGERPRAG